MNSLVSFLLYISILMIAIGYVNQIKKCEEPKVEYRYIPRTFEQEQDDPVKVSQLFNSMFADQSVWMSGYRLGGTIGKKDAHKLQ
jgi:hypothetical protein